MYRTSGNVKYRIDEDKIVDVATRVFNDLGGDSGNFDIEAIREIVKQQMTAEMIADIEADFKPIQYFGIVGDGVVDDTQGILDYAYHLKEQGGGTLYLPGGKEYVINRSIELPSNVIFKGDGASTLIKLGDDFDLTRKHYRSETDGGIFPYLSNEEQATNVMFKDFKLVGNSDLPVDQHHIGVGFIDCEDGQAHNLMIEDINYSPENASSFGIMGYNIASFRSKNIGIIGGKFERGGYENLGLEHTENAVIDRVYTGNAWRTSFQLHQGNRNVKIKNSTIIQNDPHSHAAYTSHGRGSGIIKDVYFVNNYVEMSIETTGSNAYHGTMQNFGPHDKIKFKDNVIKGVKNGLYIDGTEGTTQFSDVTGNTVTAEKGVGIHVPGDAIVSGNNVDVKNGTNFDKNSDFNVIGNNNVGFSI